MSNKFRNVHTYDGQLRGIFDDENKYTDDEKRELFSAFAELLSNQSALKMIAMIIDGIGKEGGANYDPINKVDVSNILASILTRGVMSNDILVLLEEQLADNFNLGQCPQGRSTRMIQIYSIVRDYHLDKD